VIPTSETGAKMTMTFVPGTPCCVLFSLASSWWRLCFFWSSASCSRLKNDERGGHAADRLVDGAVIPAAVSLQGPC
jgi:hypothetical protein